VPSAETPAATAEPAITTFASHMPDEMKKLFLKMFIPQ